MADVVFDIETAPVDDAEIPRSLVTKLKDRALEQGNDDPDAWRAMLGLYAPAASVIVIGLLNPASRRGQVLYDARHGEIADLAGPEGYDITLFGGDEAALLTRFWGSVGQFDRVVTYNGRGFDVPFLMQRSLIRGVEVSVDLMPPRYFRGTNHLDLADVLAQYGATRPYGLATWTEAIGAPSPKEGEVSGAGVGDAFHAGRTKEIAEYCWRDVIATGQLFDKVQQLWGPLLRRS